MTDDPVARLKAGLDADEAWFRDPRSVDDPVGEDLRQRLLRTIAAMRAVLALHQPEWVDYVDGDGDDRTSLQCKECEPPGTPDNWPCPTVLALAAIYSDDHPGGGK